MDIIDISLKQTPERDNVISCSLKRTIDPAPLPNNDRRTINSEKTESTRNASNRESTGNIGITESTRNASNTESTENRNTKITHIVRRRYLRNDKSRLEDDQSRTLLQKKFYYFFEEPRSKKGQAFALLSFVCALVTILIICLDSLPHFFIIKNVNLHLWLPIDIFIVLIFTIEYFGRFYASVRKSKFVFNIINMLNLFSIVPFYIQIFSPFSVESTLRFVRILRLTRIIKSLERIGKFSDGFMIATNVFLISSFQIFLNLTYFIIVITFSATFIYYFERGEFDYTTSKWYRISNEVKELSPFQSIFHSLYWSIETVTTTGFGDMIPKTFFGKIITALTCLSGIVVIALTSTVIGINSDREWSRYYKDKTKIDFFEMWKAIDDKRIYDLSNEEYNQKIKNLEFHYSTLAELVEEIQEKFNFIEPQIYQQKYQNLEIKHNQTIAKLSKLELEVKRYENLLRN